MEDRAKIVDARFNDRVAKQRLPRRHDAYGEEIAKLTPSQVGLSDTACIELFDSQVMTRHLDLQARLLRARNEGFYTIGSAGHEGNAVLGYAFRYTDMAFLHYRSTAFVVQRSKQLPGVTMIYDILLSLVASSDDPVSGGRHKVLGSRPLFMPPQTSTIASHLPKAVGTAFSIPLSKSFAFQSILPRDSVVICSFGDASSNHSTAQGAINTACWMAYQNIPLPIVFVCEDNGLGISVKTPQSWIEQNFSHRPALKYLQCDGRDILDTFRCAHRAAKYARQTQRPVFLHLKTQRLLGHAGSDIEQLYHDESLIEATELKDPLLHTAGLLTEFGILSHCAVRERYETLRRRVSRIADIVIHKPKHRSPTTVMAAIHPPRVETMPAITAAKRQESTLTAKELRQRQNPQHLAKLINWTLKDLMSEDERILVFGEDVGKKGGVYHVTHDLQTSFGPKRVFDSLLDEQSILGTAIGLAHNGFIPIPEIQFLAYVHNAEDQIRGEAATLSFFSDGQFHNPMVIRIAGLAYQRGFGGHFHNDNSIAVFTDIPGIIIACPSNGRDAAAMLRRCVALARDEKRVVIFIEPIALYMTRDLHSPGDQLWSHVYQTNTLDFGAIDIIGDGDDLAIVSYGNGVYLSQQAVKILNDTHGIRCRVIDIRWLLPLPAAAICDAVRQCRKVLIVDECRNLGSLSHSIVTLLAEASISGDRVHRLAAEDSFIPLGDAATLVLPSAQRIVEKALTLGDSQ